MSNRHVDVKGICAELTGQLATAAAELDRHRTCDSLGTAAVVSLLSDDLEPGGSVGVKWSPPEDSNLMRIRSVCRKST
jgi:hypothetical protein